MIIHLNSQDFRDFRYERHAHQRASSHVRVVNVGTTTTVREMANMVKEVVRMGHIERLIINSHGEPGNILIGEGMSFNNVADLRALRPYFKPLEAGGMGVLIDVCNVASDSVTENSKIFPNSTSIGITCTQTVGIFSKRHDSLGLSFLRRMARTLNTKIFAGIEIQSADENIDPGGFEGSYVIVYPNRTYELETRSNYIQPWIQQDGSDCILP